jgi:hypothetical protein
MTTDMTCPSCGKPGLIVEASADGKTRTKKCLQCGTHQVEDVQGRKLLTEVPRLPGRQLLVEG